jgi:hypothetical protein
MLKTKVEMVLRHGLQMWRGAVLNGEHLVCCAEYWSEPYARAWAERKLKSILILTEESSNGTFTASDRTELRDPAAS